MLSEGFCDMGVSFLYQGDASGFVQAPRKALGLSEQLAYVGMPPCACLAQRTPMTSFLTRNQAETCAVIDTRDAQMEEARPSREWDKRLSGMAMGCQLSVRYSSHSLPSLPQTRDPSLTHGMQTPYLLQQHAQITGSISDICLKSQKSFP